MIPVCAFPGCPLPVDSNGLCTGHRTQQRRERPPKPLLIHRPDYCHVRYCHRAADPLVPGWCRNHIAQADPALWERINA